MALTNLTFGDGSNKALFCSMKKPMRALVLQLESISEDLCQVAASVLRNLSWHADSTSKKNLKLSGAVGMLARCLLTVKKESTLKSLLSALWNFSSHCGDNKLEICATRGALQLLVWSLSFRSLTKTLAIVENGGGVLRNVSSQIATSQDYRIILRSQNCLPVLLRHLRSPSLTVVSNACGTLWNLSAHCLEDQKILCQLGAIGMLKNLVHSKHKMISMGSAAALRNLMSSSIFSDHYNDITNSRLLNNSFHMEHENISSTSLGCHGSSTKMNTSFRKSGLHMRRRRDLQRELESKGCAEMCENLESPQEEACKNIPLDNNYEDYTHRNISPDYQNDVCSISYQQRRVVKSRKLSVNLTPLKPPAYPIQLNDMICKSDTDALNDVGNRSSKKDVNDKNNHSLETDSLFPTTANGEELYKPGMFLSCHEMQASDTSSVAADVVERQNMATEFYEVNTLERQIKIENQEFITSTNQTFYNDDALENKVNVSHLNNTFSKLKTDNADLTINRNIKNVEERCSENSKLLMDSKEHLEGELIRIRTGDDGKFVDDNCINKAKKEIMSDPEDVKVQPSSYNVNISKNNENKNKKQSVSRSRIPTFSSPRSSPMRTFNNEQVFGNSRKENTAEMDNENSLLHQHASETPFDLKLSSPQPTLMSSTSSTTSTPHKTKLLPTNQPRKDIFNHETGTPTKISTPSGKSFLLSSEHEKALMENANLVLSVLERTSLTESNHSNNDVFSFLENETISLISGAAEDDDETFTVTSQDVLAANSIQNANNVVELDFDLPDLSFQDQEQDLLNRLVENGINATFNDEPIENSKFNLTYEKIMLHDNDAKEDVISLKADTKTQDIPKSRPKIMKPTFFTKSEKIENIDQQPKGIRGKRKALYPGNKSRLTTEKVEMKGMPPKPVVTSKAMSQGSALLNQKNKPINNSSSKLASKAKITSTKETNMKVNNDKATSKIGVTKLPSSQKIKMTPNQRLQQSPQRPLSALIKNTNVTSSALSYEKIKQAKLKSQSLPPGQKAPTKTDYLNMLNKSNKNKTQLKSTTKTNTDTNRITASKSNPVKNDIKQKAITKQDTFIKSKSRSASNESEKISIQNKNTRQNEVNIAGCDQSSKNTSKNRIQSRLKRPAVVGKLNTPSASSSEKLNSASSGSLRNAQNQNGYISKSGSNYSVTSNKSSRNISITSKTSNNYNRYTQPTKIGTNAVKSNNLPNGKLKQPNRYIAEEIKYQDIEENEDFGISKPRLQKSSTFDKINTIGSVEDEKLNNASKKNTLNSSGNKINTVNQSKGSSKDAVSVTKVCKIQIQKSIEEKKASKKYIPSINNNLLKNKKAVQNPSKSQQNDVSSVDSQPSEVLILDITLSKNKPIIESNKSKLVASKKASDKSSNQEKRYQNSKNYVNKEERKSDSEVTEVDEDIKNNNVVNEQPTSPIETSPRNKPHRGFSFWKKPLKSSKQASKLSAKEDNFGVTDAKNSPERTKTSTKSIGISRFNKKKLSLKTSQSENLTVQSDSKKNNSVFYYDSNNNDNNDEGDVKCNKEDKNNNGHNNKNKNNKCTKPESPIKRRVLGWFKKSHDTHQLLAKKNKLINNNENYNSTNNYNNINNDNNKSPTINNTNTINLLQTLIDELKSDDDSMTTLKSHLYTPDTLSTPISTPMSAPVGKTTEGMPTYGRSVSNESASPCLSRPTKTEMLLNRHRRSRLNSDSRSSMAMSIDSLKVNSIDSLKVNSVESFQNTSCSDQPSEATEKDDDSSFNYSDSSQFS